MVMRRGAALLEQAMQEHLFGRVLDIGCGAKAKRHLAGPRITEYVGLDHPESPHGSEQVDILATAYQIPQPEAAFDGIVCTAVLEHLEDPAAALREALRVLRPGGFAVYTVPLFWHVHEAPRDFYRYTKYGLQHLFQAAGFEVVRLSAASGFWITFGSEWSYYLCGVARGPLRYAARALVALNNAVFPWLDRIDRRLNRDFEAFTWMYLVVARKPA